MQPYAKLYTVESPIETRIEPFHHVQFSHAVVPDDRALTPYDQDVDALENGNVEDLLHLAPILPYRSHWASSDSTNMSPLLHLAVNQGWRCHPFDPRWRQVFETLATHWCVNAVNTLQFSVLHLACKQGALPLVQALTDHGANVNALDDQGGTPLHVAVSNHHPEIVEHLLQAGAKPNLRLFESERTPLMLLAGYKASNVEQNTRIMDLLTLYGADVNMVDAKHDSPLVIALSSLSINLPFVEKLLDLGALLWAHPQQSLTVFDMISNKRRTWVNRSQAPFAHLRTAARDFDQEQLRMLDQCWAILHTHQVAQERQSLNATLSNEDPSIDHKRVRRRL